MRLLWQLPGAKRFIADVLDDLLDGRTIVLLLPSYGPQDHGLRLEVVEACRQYGRVVDFLSISGESKPLRVLFDHLGLPPATRMSLAALTEAEQFHSRTFWLEGLDEETWPHWKEFLEDHQRLARNQSRALRSIFIVPLIGALAAHPPRREVGLALHEWQDVLDGLDILLLAAHLLRRRTVSAPLKMLLTTTLAQVGLFDPALAQHLADEPVERIVAPIPVLTDFARQRSWTRDTPACWEAGTACRVEAKERAHSALKAITDGIDRRLWRAQVAALFPHLEEYRQFLVQRLAPNLKVPFKTRFGGIVNHLSDLELSHLRHQVRSNGIILPRNELDTLTRAVDARNKLAHQDTLSPADLLDLLN